MTVAPAVGLIGIYGYGTAHLRELTRLAAAGRARVVACADVKAPDGERSGALKELGARYFHDWRAMLVGGALPDVVVIASPPHLHAEIAGAAMGTGAHVVLEKPPVVTLSDFERLLAIAGQSGVACQVGFQSTGSGALTRLRQMVELGELGEPLLFAAEGRWQRDRGYWSRAVWAGRESLGGRAVRDGALSNPFAHAVMNCLFVAGGPDVAITRVEVGRFRANPIEVEDTACLRVSLGGSRCFLVAVTLCAEEVEAPALLLIGPQGRGVWPYEGDLIRVESRGRSWSETFARRSLTEQLLDFIEGRVSRLSCPLAACRRFVEVVEAVHAEPVRELPPTCVRWFGRGDKQRAAVKGIDRAIALAVEQGKLYFELGVPWASPQAAKEPCPRHSTKPVAQPTGQ